MSVRDWKIGTRLAAGFGVILALLVLIIVVSLVRLSDARQTTDTLVRVDFEKSALANQARKTENDSVSLMLLFTDVQPSQIAEFDRRIVEGTARVGGLLDRLNDLLITDEGREMMRRLREGRSKIYQTTYPALKKAADAGDQAACSRILLGEVMPQREALLAIYDEFLQHRKTVVDTHAQEAMQRMQSSVVLVLVLGLGALLATLFLAWALTMSITRPLESALGAVRSLARGNTSQRFETTARDECGVLLVALDEVRASLDTLRGAAERLAAGDVTVHITLLSDEDRTGQAFQKLLATLQAVLGESEALVEAGRRGELSRRGTPERFEGTFRALVEQINQLLDAVVLPINEAASVLEAVAAHDLTARVKGAYAGDLGRIKAALNQTVSNLEAALSQVATASEEVASASRQISDGSQSLAQGASEQASTLEQVHSSLQEMSSMTQLNSSNAQEAKGLSEATLHISQRGLQSMQRLQEAIDRIKQSSDSTARVVRTIDEIAFQTNLLALNAAVEAARAGDAGKGFAVVAEEVRNLAMRSAEHAKNTAALIDDAVRNAEGGVALNAEVVDNLQAIHGSVTKVTEVMTEIAASSANQSEGVTQIKIAVEQLNQVTQQVASNSEELASASEELSAQGSEMRELVGQFHLSKASISAPLGVAPLKGKPTSVLQPATPRPLAAVHKNGNGHVPNGRSIIPFDDDSVLGEF